MLALPAQMELNVQEAMLVAGDLFKQSRFEEAGGLFSLIAEADPNNFHALSALSVCLIEQKKCAEALPFLDKVGVLLRDELVSASCNRGRALADMGRCEHALAAFNGILRNYPDHLLSRYNRGLVSLQMGRHKETIDDMNVVLASQPDNDKARFGRGFARLVLGRYKEGFVDYEYRLKDDIEEPDVPLWTGKEAIAGKAILVYGEQGLGDNIMFARYLPKLVEMGAIVYVTLPKSMRNLICNIPGVYYFDKEVTSPNKFAYWIRFMSLALAFGTDIDTIPPPMPVKYDPVELAKWEQVIGNKDRLKVGLCWAGSKDSRYDEYRTIPLERLSILMAEDAAFYSLQKDVRDDVKATFNKLPIADLSKHLDTFQDTAHAMKCLDLVITVDTSVAHLAGTVGVPTIVMLTAYRTYWLWINTLLTSPWYPSISLIKQPKDGDWDSVVYNVIQEVRDRAFNIAIPG